MKRVTKSRSGKKEQRLLIKNNILNKYFLMEFSKTRNPESTLYFGNLDERITENMLWELTLQFVPPVHVHIPRDRVSGIHQGFGFVELPTEEDAEYVSKVLSGIKMFGKNIRVNRSTLHTKVNTASSSNTTITDSRSTTEVVGVGANLFISCLSSEVDQNTLINAFSNFGTLLQPPKLVKEGKDDIKGGGGAKAFAFLSYDCFESADSAIEGLNGHYLGSQPIKVCYAFRKDIPGQRHGSPAERILASQIGSSPGSALSSFATAPVIQNPLTQQQGTGMPVTVHSAAFSEYLNQQKQASTSSTTTTNTSLSSSSSSSSKYPPLPQ